MAGHFCVCVIAFIAMLIHQKPIHVLGNGDGCIKSGATVELVQRCPQTQEAWAEAAERKNCGGIQNTCPSFVYHCVMNTWQNETVEVCAPTSIIVGKNCAEYNFLGFKIQRNYKVKCTECPSVYNSTDSFRYLECYRYVQDAKPVTEPEVTTSSFLSSDVHTTTTSSVTKGQIIKQNQSADENNTLIVVVFVIAVAVVLSAVFAIGYITKKSHVPEDEDIHEPLKSSDNTTNETVAV